ncbi:purine-cytosine permease family protein [Embleya sp. NPDC059237]|uniref:purine-cytosine permease family protein n=1 Tax=Embleya sp. NPDC059237 TaxID=3346784 RepID=UPI003691399E
MSLPHTDSANAAGSAARSALPRDAPHTTPPGTGVASDELFQVETHGIDPIPDHERHGSARDVFWLWFGSNLSFTFVINGTLAVMFGLSFRAAIAVVVITGLSFFAVGALGLAGVRTGTATLVISRAAFGVHGNFPAGLLNWVVGIGYTILNTVVGTFALEGLFAKLGWAGGDLARVVALAITLSLTFAVAMWGHATVQAAERWMAYVLGIGFGLLILFVVPGLKTGDAPETSNTFHAISLAVLVMVAGPISYLPMPSDYTRYLPRDTSLRSITLWGAAGGMLSSVLLGVLGVAAATQADMSDPVTGVADLVPGWFEAPFLLLVVGGSITNSILTLYSSSLNLQVLGIPWSRSKGILVSTAFILVGSLWALFNGDFTDNLTSFLSVLVVVFAPWGGVFIADTLMRRCRYDADGLHDMRGGAYWYTRGFHPAGMIALGAGIVFAALTAESALWTGALVETFDGDFTLLGAVVSGLLYWALARREPQFAKH